MVGDRPPFHHHHADHDLTISRLAVTAVPETAQLRRAGSFEIRGGDVIESQVRLQTEQISQLSIDFFFNAFFLGPQIIQALIPELQLIEAHLHPVGLQRRNRKDTFDYIQQAEARTDWQECPVGMAAAEKALVPKTRVGEVAGKEPGVRVFVVHSEEREAYERGLREMSLERVRKDLQALQAQIEKGTLKEPEKIGAAAATKLRRNHGYRYFDWELREGKFRFFEHPINLAREKALEGKYVIQTEERNLSAVEAVSAYKELNEVERGFSHLKHLLELRPVYHQSDACVEAHVFVAALALLLDRALEKSLQAAGSLLSTPFAWQALEMIRCVEVDLGQRRKICLTRGNQHVAETLRVLGITQLDPPSPPEGREWLM